MLRKKQKEILFIFYNLCSHETSTKDLSNKLVISKRAVKDSIKELNSLIFEYYDLKNFIEITSTGIVFIQPDFQSESLVIFHQLKLELLKKSYDFQIITHIFFSKNSTLVDLSEKLYLSVSYTNRLLKKLNKYLIKFRYQIVEDDKGFLKLNGNELYIRLYIYILLSNSYQMLEFPFNKNHLFNNQFSKENFDFSILTSIIDKRSSYKNFLPELSEPLLSFIKISEKNLDLYKIINNNLIFDSKFLTNPNEHGYLHFFSHVFISNNIPEQLKIDIGNHYLLNANTDFSYFVSELVNKFWKAFNLNYDSNKISKTAYYVSLFTIYLNITGIDFYNFNELSFPQSNYNMNTSNHEYKKIKKYIELFTTNNTDNKFALFLLENPLLQDFYCGILYTQSEHYSFPSLKIHINLSKLFMSHDFMIERLTSIYNKDVIIFCESSIDADLIITDHLSNKDTGLEIFYFDTLSDVDQWKKLLNLIEDLIFNKLVP